MLKFEASGSVIKLQEGSGSVMKNHILLRRLGKCRAFCLFIPLLILCLTQVRYLYCSEVLIVGHPPQECWPAPAPAPAPNCAPASAPLPPPPSHFLAFTCTCICTLTCACTCTFLLLGPCPLMSSKPLVTVSRILTCSRCRHEYWIGRLELTLSEVGFTALKLLHTSL